jgi:hypothetical protein
LKLSLLIVLAVTVASCSTTKPTVELPKADSVKPQETRITFGFTSSGIGNRPSDAIRLDSTGQMTYITRSRISGSDFSALTGMAILEDRDYDELNSIVKRGNLTMIDSTDIGVKCSQGQGEMYSLAIRRTDQKQTVNLVFDECSATDYNLLLEPQRSAFKELINWFSYVRGKYRPAKP